MTTYALRILEAPAGAEPKQLEQAALVTRVVQSLATHADECGPYGLSRWAECRHRPLYYVDNCWVRAAVHGRDIPDFFRDVLRGGPPLDNEIEPEREYLIEAEEY